MNPDLFILAMNDTTPEMYQYQYNLIMSKTPEERFAMGLEMMETGRELMLAGIRMQHPELNKDEVRFELLMRLRKYDESLSWIDNHIPELRKAYHL